jgi:hypothetical protein
MKVLVCGGRNYQNKNKVYSILDSIHRETPISLIIHGGAKGADSFAREWAIDNDIIFQTYHADWNRYGKVAGRFRNTEMLEKSQPNLVVAFPGGNGTAHMISITKKQNTPLMVIEHDD